MPLKTEIKTNNPLHYTHIQQHSEYVKNIHMVIQLTVDF